MIIYTVAIDLSVPREKVIGLLFDEPSDLKHWQKGFISYTPVSGEYGKMGSKSLLKYKQGKRDFDLIETVKIMNLPDEFCATYESKGFWNETKNTFEEVDDKNTRWTMQCQVKLSGFMKLVGFFMPGSFRKQSQEMADDFKKYAESL